MSLIISSHLNQSVDERKPETAEGDIPRTNNALDTSTEVEVSGVGVLGTPGGHTEGDAEHGAQPETAVSKEPLSCDPVLASQVLDEALPDAGSLQDKDTLNPQKNQENQKQASAPMQVQNVSQQYIFALMLSMLF